jgi:hypothetical protein
MRCLQVFNALLAILCSTLFYGCSERVEEVHSVDQEYFCSFTGNRDSIKKYLLRTAKFRELKIENGVMQGPQNGEVVIMKDGNIIGNFVIFDDKDFVLLIVTGKNSQGGKVSPDFKSIAYGMPGARCRIA